MTDRIVIVAYRLRQIAGQLDAEGTLGGRIAADDLREAADILDALVPIPSTRVYGEQIPAPTPQSENT